MKHAKGLSAADRTARSQLHQLLQQADGLIHGSLIRMRRRCGNPNCRCLTQDQKHESWYLGRTQNRKTRMKHIGKDKETAVRRWVDAHRKARQMLEQISAEAWKRLREE